LFFSFFFRRSIFSSSIARGHEAALEDGYYDNPTGVGCLAAGEFQLAGTTQRSRSCVAGVDMSSLGVMHARQFKTFERMSLDPFDAQAAHAYPASYEEARRRLLSQLLSMPVVPLEESTPVAAPCDPVTDIPDFGLSRDREHADKSSANLGPAGGKRQGLGEFCYVSSFDRLTSKKRKTRVQPAPVRIGLHLLNVLAVTAGLVVGAFVLASAGGGFPGLSAGVRSFVSDQVAKVRLILPGNDVGTLPAAPAPMTSPSVKEASAEQAPSINTGSTDHLLYSTASIANTPLK
jgi:hypothetical protein